MVLGDMAGHLIRRLNQQSTSIFAQRTQEAGFDLTPVQFAALDAIYTHPGSDQAYIAEIIGYDRATIGGVMERLLKKGWIRRVVNAQDRRSRELSLTAKGNKVRLVLIPIVQDFQKEILKPLSLEKQDALIKLIREIVQQGAPRD
jgi:MarR family transcriptional regulator, temperature-dependent positive regulator of motility